jgi:raffinose/stachyose/melibiose transport system substrate-binding protein
MKSHLWKLVSLAVVVFMLVGCGAAVAPTAAPTTAPTAAATIPPQAVTLAVWDQFARDTESAVMDGLNAQFEKDHPGVTVNRTVKSYDDLKVTIKLALSDPNGPDVGQVNQGADMGAVVQGNLLVDLTPYLPTYNWDKIFSAGMLARNSWTADGKSFGTGNLYGVSPTGEVVGVFYNKTKFQALGLSVPKTLAEFEADLAKAKEAGEIPIYFGNLDQWPGIHLFSAIEHVLLPNRTWLDDFVYGRNNVSFDIPENVQAATKLQEWVQAGYLTEGFAGIGYDDSWKQYAGGQGVFLITGSWASGDLVANGGENFGFFLMPPVQEGGKALAVGGIGLPFCIRAGSKNQDLAAAYLDWMVSPQAAEAWVAKGILPAMPVDASKVPAGTLLGEIVTAFGTLNQSDGMGHYLDWAGPTMYDTLNASIQELMALKLTPQEFTAQVQAAYVAGKQ